MMRGDEELLYICEVPVDMIDILQDQYVVRTPEFGINVDDPEKIPRSPQFVKQPEDAMFDLVKRDSINFVSMTCLGKIPY